MARKKVRRLSFPLKLEVINLVDSGKSQKDVQDILGLLPYQVRDILRYKDKLLAHRDGEKTSSSTKAIRDDVYADLNMKICQWMEQIKRETGSMPSNTHIRNKALFLAKKDHIKTFKASYCWIYKMKERVNQVMESTEAEASQATSNGSLAISDFLEVSLEESPESEIPSSVLDSLVDVYAKIKEASIMYKVDPIRLVKQLDSHLEKVSPCRNSQYFKGSLRAYL